MDIAGTQGRHCAGIIMLALGLLSGCGGEDAAESGPMTLTSAQFATGPKVQQSGDYHTVFGPARYVRGRAAPVMTHASFDVTAADTDCKLAIYNGTDADNRVRSAVIRLNDTALAGPSDFGRNVAAIERAVTLLPSNRLDVELRGIPGSELTVEILCAASAEPFGTAIWDAFNWDNGATWQ